MSLMELHRTVWDHGRPFQRQRARGVALRTYRAVSWLECAGSRGQDAHATFVFLWISFNAAYGAKPTGRGNDVDGGSGFEHRAAFFDQLHSSDRDGALTAALSESRETVLALLRSKQIFWRHVRKQEGARNQGNWESHFRSENDAVQRALGDQAMTADALRIVFDRLSTLRNLLMHGQISWRSRVVQPVVESAVGFLWAVVPVFVRLMIDHRDAQWSEPVAYPDVYRQERIEPKPDLP